MAQGIRTVCWRGSGCDGIGGVIVVALTGVVVVVVAGGYGVYNSVVVVSRVSCRVLYVLCERSYGGRWYSVVLMLIRGHCLLVMNASFIGISVVYRFVFDFELVGTRCLFVAYRAPFSVRL